MIETDFGWALAKMRDGYKVRRKGWPPGESIALADGDTRIVWEDGASVKQVANACLLAYDWELADAHSI